MGIRRTSLVARSRPPAEDGRRLVVQSPSHPSACARFSSCRRTGRRQVFRRERGAIRHPALDHRQIRGPDPSPRCYHSRSMPPHSIGSGTISFGLVSIPIKLYAAASSQGVSFNMLHAKCGTRVRQQYVCPVDNNEVVERSDIVKGYEFAKDQYVRVTDQELKTLEGEASKMIDILEFVPLAQVDPVYFEKAYYLGADKGGEKPYRLLADAMAQAEQVAVAKFVMRGKESLVLIRPAQDGLLLHTMFFADEVRSFADVDKGRSANVREGELELALQLIRGLARDEFKPEQYKDEYRGRVMDMLERKVEGREVTAAPTPAERPHVIDLMEALKASLAKKGLPAEAATAKKPPSKAAQGAAPKVAAKAVPKRASGGRK